MGLLSGRSTTYGPYQTTRWTPAASFWTAYMVLFALVAALVVKAFFMEEAPMQPWDAVQVSNEENPNHGRAGIVTQINRESGQTVVRLDADSERPVVEVAVDVSELKRL